MRSERTFERSDEEYLELCYWLVRVELTIATHLIPLRSQSLAGLGLTGPDPSPLRRLLQRAEAVWLETGCPHILNRDQVVTLVRQLISLDQISRNGNDCASEPDDSELRSVILPPPIR
jgi:hypothetical protein